LVSLCIIISLFFLFFPLFLFFCRKKKEKEKSKKKVLNTQMDYTKIPASSPQPGVCRREDSARLKTAMSMCGDDKDKAMALDARYGTAMFILHGLFQDFLRKDEKTWVFLSSPVEHTAMWCAAWDFVDGLAKGGYAIFAVTAPASEDEAPGGQVSPTVRMSVTVGQPRPPLVAPEQPKKEMKTIKSLPKPKVNIFAK
jgi:hypothetical protein